MCVFLCTFHFLRPLSRSLFPSRSINAEYVCIETIILFCIKNLECKWLVCCLSMIYVCAFVRKAREKECGVRGTRDANDFPLLSYFIIIIIIVWLGFWFFGWAKSRADDLIHGCVCVCLMFSPFFLPFLTPVYIEHFYLCAPSAFSSYVLYTRQLASIAHTKLYNRSDVQTNFTT